MNLFTSFFGLKNYNLAVWMALHMINNHQNLSHVADVQTNHISINNKNQVSPILGWRVQIPLHQPTIDDPITATTNDVSDTYKQGANIHIIKKSVCLKRWEWGAIRASTTTMMSISSCRCRGEVRSGSGASWGLDACPSWTFNIEYNASNMVVSNNN